VFVKIYYFNNIMKSNNNFLFNHFSFDNYEETEEINRQFDDDERYAYDYYSVESDNSDYYEDYENDLDDCFDRELEGWNG